MNILHVMESTATGVLTMAAALASEQSRVHAVSVIYSKRPESPTHIERFFPASVSLVRLQMSRPAEQISALYQLRKRILLLAPDAVFLHSSIAGFLGRFALLGCLKRTKIFYLPHCISFMRKDVGPLKRLAFRLLERIANIKSAVYVACSASERDEIVRSLPGVVCLLVENAVDVGPEFALVCQKSKSENAIRTVVTVGQIRAQKNPLEFAKIAELFKHNHPNIQFVWIGDGDEQLKLILSAAGVNLLGWLSKADVMKQLSMADAYISTSLWEGLPVSVLEAMYVGVPLVLADCQGNRDAIQHGVSGYVYRSVNDAVTYLNEVLSNGERARELAEAAFAVFQKRFTFEKYFSTMESLLQSSAVNIAPGPTYSRNHN